MNSTAITEQYSRHRSQLMFLLERCDVDAFCSSRHMFIIVRRQLFARIKQISDSPLRSQKHSDKPMKIKMCLSVWDIMRALRSDTLICWQDRVPTHGLTLLAMQTRSGRLTGPGKVDQGELVAGDKVHGSDTRCTVLQCMSAMNLPTRSHFEHCKMMAH